MIFSSAEFIFFFLPFTVSLFFLLIQCGRRQLAKIFLTLASLIFYAWWNVSYLWLLLISIAVNYTIGHYLQQITPDEQEPLDKSLKLRKGLLVLGLFLNLIALGYFKYTNFFIDSLNGLFSSNFTLQAIVLPLALSFFTFTQIAYLVDAYRGKSKSYSLLDYSLFITFFPHLIAGPIIHHHELIPQFESSKVNQIQLKNIAIGLTVFGIGLFKKVVFADYSAGYANTVFYQAAHSSSTSLMDGWIGAIAYTIQLYFDFSGYSDMAIGSALLFNIQFPINFNSPYKAISIVDFWRRWHITLSNFLRDYLYIPLGGSRLGPVRRHLNLLITMLLGGLWHGAGWTFVIWGGMHGLCLIINHQWNSWQKQGGFDYADRYPWTRRLAVIVTFITVMTSWIFFRAETLSSARQIVIGLSGFTGFASSNWRGLELISTLGVLGILLGIIGFAPNTQQIIQLNDRQVPVPNLSIGSRLLPLIKTVKSEQWIGILKKSSSTLFGLGLGFIFFLCSKLFLSAASSEFLYFNF
jgi:alginate O-acetyltransferase complex protein AlgI